MPTVDRDVVLATEHRYGDVGLTRAIVAGTVRFSAYGFIVTNARVDRQRTTQLTSRWFDAVRASKILEDLVADAIGELKAQDFTDDLVVYRALAMRYLGQNYELELTVTAADLAPERAAALWASFHEAHKLRFGFSISGETIEIVNYLATVVSIGDEPAFPQLANRDGPPEPVGRRLVVFASGRHEAPVYRRETLLAGHVIAGPAVVEEAASVTILAPGRRLEVDWFGSLHLAAATTS